MTNGLTDQFDTLPTAVLLLSALSGAGWLMLRTAGMRGIRPVAPVPTISILILMANGPFQAIVGKPWGWIPVTVTTILLTLVTTTAKRLINRRDPGILLIPENQREGMTMHIGGRRAEHRLFLMILVFWTATALPVILTIPFNTVSQSGDALYHYVQVVIIEREDYASMFSPNTSIFRFMDHAGFYLVVRHQVAGLGAWGWRGTLIADNVLPLAVALVWYPGLVYLVRTALPKARHAPYLASVASLLAPVFPWRLAYGAALWPCYMVVATCPVVIAISIECWRRVRTLMVVVTRGQNTSVWGAQACAAMALSVIIPLLVGSRLIHISAAAMLLWPLFGVLLCQVVHSGIRSWCTEQRTQAVAWWIGALLTVAVFVAFIVLPGPRQYHFGRYTELNRGNLTTKPLIPITLDYFGGWVIEWIKMPLATLCLLGSAIRLWRRRNRELVVAWILSTSLILAAITPIPVLSASTDPFYRVPHRTKVMATVLAVLLVVVALDALRTWLGPLGVRVGSALRGALGRIGLASVSTTAPGAGAAAAALAVCLPVMLIGNRAMAIDVCEGYLPMYGDTRFIADKAELNIIRWLLDELPDNAAVIGDPVAKTSRIPILTGMYSAQVFSGQAADDQDGIYLCENSNRTHTGLHVCELLQRYGTHYFYADKDVVFNGNRFSRLRPGLHEVDTSGGFTLADSGGSALLWCIDIHG